MNYSTNFERDFLFYSQNINNFKFCGTLFPKFKAISDANGISAKKVFYLIDSTGKNSPTNEGELLDSLLLCKASVNFQIKQWAEGMSDGTLSNYEFNGEGKTLEWKWNEDKTDATPIYHNSIKNQYNLPEWVITAVQNQIKN